MGRRVAPRVRGKMVLVVVMGKNAGSEVQDSVRQAGAVLSGGGWQIVKPCPSHVLPKLI